MTMNAGAAILILALTPVPAGAQPTEAVRQQTLQERVEAKLRQAGPGTRFGLMVVDEDGREIVAILPGQRFIPASNMKMFTTAAAFATITGLDAPDVAGGASVRLEARGRGADVVLKGYGDARLSSAADCITNCLATLADAVAARTRKVSAVVGDASFLPDMRWSPGMSWNNIQGWYGTAISALTLDDNELPIRIFATAPGEPPRLELLPYYEVDNRAVTAAAGAAKLEVVRFPGSRKLRLTGTIAAGAEPERIRLGIDDPAHYAAWRFKSLLEARGVRVGGDAVSRYRAPMPADDPAVRNGAPPARPPEPEALARLAPPPLGEDIRIINKVSQNLHAELLLRRVGNEQGTGSIPDGLAAVRAMLEQAGVARSDYDFADGSGMSSYNRVAPQGMITFLRWAGVQPWGVAWRETLPVAGVDGTLARRFKGTPLERRLFAKTGTLNGTAALSGYMTAKSGRTLTFSAYANDIPEGAAATGAMDSALELIAGEN
jgi:D-alanyl-D-alanine carboxypeptidase/D-alanyl-D-alanine-endopeptidase (penicillin-binding protein 4)